MPSNIARDISTLGFLSRSATLRTMGHSQRAIDSALRAGTLLRPVRSWVATPHAERDAVIALLHGGVLTGASALGSLGVWRGVDRSINILVPPNNPGRISRCPVPLTTFVPPRHLTTGVVKHWGEQRFSTRALDWRASAVDALTVFAHGTELEQFVAAVDSALYTRALRPSELSALFHALPARFQGALPLINGRSESGTESIARLRLAAVARSIEIQVPVGRHRIDILLDGWLAIEIDSEEWHSDSRVGDLRKSTWLTGRGFRVEHYDYQQVMNEWPSVERAIREALAKPQLPPLR